MLHVTSRTAAPNVVMLPPPGLRAPRVALAVLLSVALLCAWLSISSAPARAEFKGTRPETRHQSIPVAKLNNGVLMPYMSFGIWQLSNADVEAQVPLALSLGINHIDASIWYGCAENGGPPNQPALGEVLADHPRDTYFLTTKIDPDARASKEYGVVASPLTVHNAYFRTIEQAAHNLADLRVGYVDLMLVHWSSESCAVMSEIWRGMEFAYQQGWARAIGVSNYCPNTLSCILDMATVKPAVNQVKYHAGMNSAQLAELKTYTDAHDIVLQAYSPLGSMGKYHSAELIDGATVRQIADKYGKSGAQVSLRWVAQHGVPFSTKSSKESHMLEAIAAFDFSLSDEDMATLDAFDNGRPEVCAEEWQMHVPCLAASLTRCAVHDPTDVASQTYSFSCACDRTGTCKHTLPPYQA